MNPRSALLLLAVALVPFTSSAHRRVVLPGPWLANGYFDGEDDSRNTGFDIVTDASGRWLASDIYDLDTWSQIDFGLQQYDGTWIMGYAVGFSCVVDGCDHHATATQAITPAGDLLMVSTYGENVTSWPGGDHGPGVTGGGLWRVRADGTWQDSDFLSLGGVSGELAPRHIAATSDNGFVLFGTFLGDTQFAGLPVTSQRHLFLARFDSALQPLWARDLTPNAEDADASAVRIDAQGQVIVGGSTTGNGGQKPFLAAYDLDGALQSLIPSGHPGDEVVSLATAGDTLYVLTRSHASGNGQSPGWFLRALGPQGERWTRSGGGTATALAADANSVFVGGNANASFNVAGREVTVTDGQQSLFVGALETSGAPRWVYTASSDTAEPLHVSALAVFPTGEPAMEGDAIGNVDWREGFVTDIPFRFAYTLSFATR